MHGASNLTIEDSADLAHQLDYFGATRAGHQVSGGLVSSSFSGGSDVPLQRGVYEGRVPLAAAIYGGAVSLP